MNRIIARLDKPLVTLQAYADRIARLPAAQSHARMYPLIKGIDSYAIHAARVSAYLSARYMHGKDHAAAVIAQNRTAAKVRAVLGYTYHRDDLTF